MQRVIAATDVEIVGAAQVWQGGSVLVVVEDPVGVKAVNMRNHERPPILSSMAGGPLTLVVKAGWAGCHTRKPCGLLHLQGWMRLCVRMCPQARRRNSMTPACSSLGESLLRAVAGALPGKSCVAVRSC